MTQTKPLHTERTTFRQTLQQKRVCEMWTIEDSVELGTITNLTEIIHEALCEWAQRRGRQYPDYTPRKA